MHRFSRAFGLVGLLPVIVTTDLAAQGVTSAALYGKVRSADSGGVAEAVVTVTNYAFEYLSVGGPHAAEARGPCARVWVSGIHGMSCAMRPD